MLRIDREKDPRVCVAHLEGEIDISVVPSVKAALDSTVEGGCENLILDLSEVTYADSSALGLLVWLDHRLTPRGGKLILAGANRDVARVLELSGLVNIAPSIAASPSVVSAMEGLELSDRKAELLWEETLVMPAIVHTLSESRSRIVGLLDRVSLSEAALFDIKVAVGEALANAMRHGSPHPDSDEVRVRVAAYDDRVLIAVTDAGEGFEERPGSSDLYATSGRGIMFMRALMDKVEFQREPGGGTTVTLTKHLRPNALA